MSQQQKGAWLSIGYGQIRYQSNFQRVFCVESYQLEPLPTQIYIFQYLLALLPDCWLQAGHIRPYDISRKSIKSNVYHVFQKEFDSRVVRDTTGQGAGFFSKGITLTELDNFEPVACHVGIRRATNLFN